MAATNAQVPETSLDHTHLLHYGDGELLWAAPGGNIQEPLGRLKAEEIVFILKPSSSDGDYLIYSLSEPTADHEAPFKLSALALPAPPQALLDAYLVPEPPAHLRSDSSHQLHVVVSTKSGLCKAQPFYDGVLHPLLAAVGLNEEASLSHTESSGVSNYGYKVTTSQSPQSIRDFARQLAGAEPPAPGTTLPGQTVILLSGDGGIVDMLNGGSQAPSTRPPTTVCILPLGTGNALFHSLHKPHYTAKDGASAPSPFVRALRTLFAGTAAPLPAFRASFSPGSRLVSYADPGAATGDADAAAVAERLQERTQAVDHLFGAIVASYGFHASLVWESDTPAYRQHGDKRFGMAAQELLKLSHAYDAAVEVRGPGASSAAPWADVAPARSGRFSYVLATLVSNLERTFTVSPASRPLDGRLRLVHFGDVGGAKTMEIMMAAYQDGAHVGMSWEAEGGGGTQTVGYDEIEAVKVTIREEDPRWRKVCVDGTIVEIEQGGWMVVEKMHEWRLQVLVRK